MSRSRRRALAGGWAIALVAWALAGQPRPAVAQGGEAGPEGPSGLARALQEFREEGLARAGRPIYRARCAICHGLRGDGEGPLTRYLDPRPRDFTRGDFKFRSTPSGSLPTDGDLLRTVSRGVPGTAMPPWEDLLGPDDRQAVVQYVKTFSPRFREETPQPPIAVPPPPPLSAAGVEEGKRIFMLMRCWDCHGAQGHGDGPSARSLKDDWGHPVRPYDFTRGGYKGGGSPQDIYRTFTTGLTGTPMPAFAEVMLFAPENFPDLSQQERAFPAGEVDRLRAYLRSLPHQSDLEATSPEALDTLATHRRWSLVQYVLSLSRERGVLYRLFVEDTESIR